MLAYAEMEGSMLQWHRRWTKATPARTWLVVIVTLFASVWLVLLAYMLFVAFPTMAETSDAQLQVWLGPQGARRSGLSAAAPRRQDA
jgi:hypothetical protein